MPNGAVPNDGRLADTGGAERPSGGRKAPGQLAIVLACLAVLTLGSPAWAGRPLETEDTGTLDPGRAELELALAVSDESGARAWAGGAVLNVGVAPRLEANIELGGAHLQRRDEPDQAGVTDLVVGLKHRLVDETEARPALLANVRLRLPTGDPDRGLGSEGVDVVARLALSKAFGPLTLTANGGYAFVTADRGLDVCLASAAAEYQVTPAWTAVAEVVGSLGARAGPDVVVARAGLVHALGRSVRLDAAVGAGLTRNSPDVVATVGVTIGF